MLKNNVKIITISESNHNSFTSHTFQFGTDVNCIK